MEGNKDQFFDMFKESFDGFAPEAPGSVYTGMRKKLFWTGFTTFSAGKFNAWYLALLIGAASVTGGVCLMDEGMQGQSALMNNSIDELVHKPHNQIVESESWDDNSNLTEETLDLSTASIAVMSPKKDVSKKGIFVGSEKNLESETPALAEAKSKTLKSVSTEAEAEAIAEPGENKKIESVSTEQEHTSSVEAIETIDFNEIDNVRFHKDLMRQLKSKKGEIVIDLVVKLPTEEE